MTHKKLITLLLFKIIKYIIYTKKLFSQDKIKKLKNYLSSTLNIFEHVSTSWLISSCTSSFSMKIYLHSILKIDYNIVPPIVIKMQIWMSIRPTHRVSGYCVRAYSFLGWNISSSIHWHPYSWLIFRVLSRFLRD